MLLAAHNHSKFHGGVYSVNERHKSGVFAGTQFLMIVVLNCFCIFTVLTIIHMHSKKKETVNSHPRFDRLSTPKLNKYFSSRCVNASTTVHTTTVNSTLWDLFGCDKKRPLFSCNITASRARRLPGNIVAANRQDFDHPLLQKKLNNCAVVGSSGRLLKEEWGKDIDRHDIVVRVNYPPIKGYEKHVGSRHADILFFSDKLNRCYNESFKAGSQLIVFPLPLERKPKRVAFDICKENTKIRLLAGSKYLFDHTRALIYNFALIHRSPGTKKPHYRAPSSGFRAVFFCMMVCRNVDVYGFGSSGDKNEPVHYYENSTDRTHFTTHHNPDGEFRLMTYWMKTKSPDDLGKVRVF